MNKAGVWQDRTIAILFPIWFFVNTAAVVMWVFSGGVKLGFAIVAATFGVWPLFFFWAIVPLIAIVCAAKALFAGKGRRAIAWSALPMTAALIFFYGPTASEIARFQFNKTAYLRVVADAAAGNCAIKDQARWHVAIDAMDCAMPVTIIFVWGGFGSIWYGVVYDAADQIMNAPEQRTEAWKQRDIGRMLSCSGASRALGHHFFLTGGNYAC